MFELLAHLRLPTWICFIAAVIAVNRATKSQGVSIWIGVLLVLNFTGDFVGVILLSKGFPNAGLYNTSTVIEQVITLWIYLKYSDSGYVVVKRVLIGLVIAMALSNTLFTGWNEGFHWETFILSGIIVAVVSYLEFRAIVLTGNIRNVILWFALANLIYYTLMVPSMSSVPKAYKISEVLSYNLKLVNDAAYIAWSIILSIALLWFPKSST